ncbi:MAG: ABC transporter ATP-binding protein [Candidatus Omnitrophota bacterium]
MPFFSFIKPYRRSVLLILLCMFVSNILALCLPWGVKIIVDTVLTGADKALLKVVLLILLAVLCMRTALNFLHKYISALVGERIVADLRSRLYAHVHSLPLVRIRQMAPSQILTRITSDVDSIRRFVFGDALDFVYSVFAVGAILIVLGLINGRMMLCAVLIMPLFAVIYFGGVPRLKKRYARLRDAHGRMTSRINEVLGGMATVRAFGATKHECDVFEVRQRDVVQVAGKVQVLNTALWVGSEFFSSAGIVGVLWIGGLDVMSGRLTPGELVAFYSYLGMLFAPLIRMVVINSSYQEALAALERIEDVFRVDEEQADVQAPVVLSGLRGEVVFDDVSFQYEQGRAALKGVSFTVMPGETVAVVGPSGAGKSTLVGLILRLFDAYSGRVLIDGNDVRVLDLDAYRSQVAVVLQDDFLFQDSVEANIGYACAGVTPAQVVKAAKAAQAHDFISALPGGYNMKVGERGVHLSCGQRQRLAIARALVRNPRILLLDEATSAVDAMTENVIQKAVRDFGEKKTIFIVAHRFSTIMDADRVIVLRDGRLEAAGVHETLMVRSDFYRELYNEQFKRVGEEVLARDVLS